MTWRDGKRPWYFTAVEAAALLLWLVWAVAYAVR